MAWKSKLFCYCGEIFKKPKLHWDAGFSNLYSMNEHEVFSCELAC